MARGCSFKLSTAGSTATGVRPGSGWLPLLFDVAAVLFASNGQSCIPCAGAVSVPLGSAATGILGRRRVVFAFAFCGFFCFTAPGLVQQLCVCAEAVRQFSSPAALALDGVASAAITFMLLQPNKQPPAIHTETQTARSNRVNLMNRATFIDGSLLPLRPHCRENPRLGTGSD